jgi:hypothetical protein
MECGMDIPDDLAGSIARGDAVLFVGAGLSAAAGLPSWRELLDPLAERIGLPAEQRFDLLKVAQHYANQRGLQALLSYVIDATATFDKAPTDNHRRLPRLGIRTWITTNYDDLLEQTLRQQRVRFTRIVRDRDLPYASAGMLTLIKLHGDRDQPDTIVITQQDYANYFRRFPRVREKLSSLLVDKTFLFVGYSVSDPDFAQIQSGITFDLQEHQRMAYAVLFDADEFTLADMRSRNIQVLSVSASPADRSARLGDLLEELIRSVEALRPPGD